MLERSSVLDEAGADDKHDRERDSSLPFLRSDGLAAL